MSNEREFRVRRTNKKKVDKIMLLSYGAVVVVCVIVALVLGAFGDSDKDAASSLIASSEQTAISSALSSEENLSSEEMISSSNQISSTASNQVSSTVSNQTSSTVSTITSSNKTTSTNVSSNVTSAYVPNGDWRLVIANKEHPLPESYKVNVSYVSGNYRLDSRVSEAYKSMISAAKKDGVSLVIISGFRTFQGQTSLFNNKVNYYLNQGYSREKAKELAAQYVAPPGTSEHLTGLAVDLISPDWYSYNNDLNSKFEKTKQFKWLYENCADYGFVLRYPKDKVSITGYSYEPWHYRYVGVEAAKEIMSKKICLEEYVADLD